MCMVGQPTVAVRVFVLEHLMSHINNCLIYKYVNVSYCNAAYSLNDHKDLQRIIRQLCPHDAEFKEWLKPVHYSVVDSDEKGHNDVSTVVNNTNRTDTVYKEPIEVNPSRTNDKPSKKKASKIPTRSKTKIYTKPDTAYQTVRNNFIYLYLYFGLFTMESSIHCISILFKIFCCIFSFFFLVFISVNRFLLFFLSDYQTIKGS